MYLMYTAKVRDVVTFAFTRDMKSGVLFVQRIHHPSSILRPLWTLSLLILLHPTSSRAAVIISTATEVTVQQNELNTGLR